MTYLDDLIHELIDIVVRKWIDTNINYVGEPFWEFGKPGFIDIYYHWLGKCECVSVSVEEIKKNELN